MPSFRPFRNRYSLDTAAITLLLTVFTFSLVNNRYAVSPILSNTKWGVLGAFVFYSIFRNIGNFKIPTSGTAFLFLSLPLVGFVSTMLQLRNLDEGARWVIGYFVLYIIAQIVPTPTNPVARLAVWSRSFTYASGVAVWLNIALAGDPSLYHEGRYYGFMNHPNFVAAFGSIFSVAMVGRLIFGTKRQRILFLINLAAGLYCLVSSGARGALYATIAASLVLLFQILSRKNAVTVSVATAVLVGPLIFARNIINLVAPTQVVERRFDLADRTDIWARQTEAFLRSPFIGGGFEMRDGLGVGRSGGEGSYGDMFSAVGVLGAVPFFLGTAIALLRYYRFLGRLKYVIFNSASELNYFTIGFGLTVWILIVCISEEWIGTVGTPIAIFLWVALCAAGSLRIPRGIARPRRTEPYLPEISKANVRRHIPVS